MPRYKPLVERFREKYIVSPATGCWNWQGATVGIGYGHIGGERGRGSHIAHRLSYEIHVGPIPDGLIICHRCDNPACVNPDHLYAADHATNMREMAAKGRARILSSAEVKECIRRMDEGESYARIARELGVSRSTVTRVIKAAQDGDFGGQSRQGSKYYNILSDDDRNAVKAALKDESLSIMRIAQIFKIDRRTVRNIRDGRTGKGRQTAITKEQAKEIVEYWKAGFRQAEIGRLFGISQTYVSCIVRGKSWSDIRSSIHSPKPKKETGQ